MHAKNIMSAQFPDKQGSAPLGLVTQRSTCCNILSMLHAIILHCCCDATTLVIKRQKKSQHILHHTLQSNTEQHKRGFVYVKNHLQARNIHLKAMLVFFYFFLLIVNTFRLPKLSVLFLESLFDRQILP